MVKFKVLKDELRPRGSGFKIPLQIILEDDERSIGLLYLEDELKTKMNNACFVRDVWAKDSDKMIIGFNKEEVPKLQGIVESVKNFIESIIQQYVREKRQAERERKESQEKERQDLGEIKRDLQEIDFN